MGSVNVLEAVRKSECVRSLVYITSDKAYENVEWLWGYRENDTIGGRDPYSASKGAAEIVFSSYLRSYFAASTRLGAASTRAGNVIGGGDWAVDRIIPDAIRAVQRGVALQLRNPNATRPWQHVLEPVSGYLKLALALRSDPSGYSGSWNFGPPAGSVRTVQSVASSLYKHLGHGEIETADSGTAVHEANLLQLNCDKANQVLNWQAKWSADEAVLKTSSWYGALLKGEDMARVTSRQINEYFGASDD
jgi:CDP-glucose 4,6-dehydratase